MSFVKHTQTKSTRFQLKNSMMHADERV